MTNVLRWMGSSVVLSLAIAACGDDGDGTTSSPAGAGGKGGAVQGGASGTSGGGASLGGTAGAPAGGGGASGSGAGGGASGAPGGSGGAAGAPAGGAAGSVAGGSGVAGSVSGAAGAAGAEPGDVCPEIRDAEGNLPSPSLTGCPDIPSPYSESDELHDVPVAPGGGENKLRFSCSPTGDLRYDDPIVKPDQPGASHLHLFYGNDLVHRLGQASHITYDMLRKSIGLNKSHCNYVEAMVNTSLYWVAPLVQSFDAGPEKVRRPDHVIVYYVKPVVTDPICNWDTNPKGMAKACTKGIVQGLRGVFGWNPQKPDEAFSSDPNVANAARGAGNWYCGAEHVASAEEAMMNPACKVGESLVMEVNAPPCWDGKYLDTANHRSHLAYGSYGSWGYLKCPDTHPYLVAQISIKSIYMVTEDMYTHDAMGNRTGVRVSLTSDMSYPGHKCPAGKAGCTPHGDIFLAWGRNALDHLEAGAFNGKSTNVGDLGDGKEMNGNYPPPINDTNRFSDVPPMP